MDRLPTWPVAAASLVAGFAVAELTGVRPVGGVVLFLGALWCGLRWRALRGWVVAFSLVAFYLLAFAISHRLGDEIGAWPSVFAVAVATGLVSWAAADRDRPFDVETPV